MRRLIVIAPIALAACNFSGGADAPAPTGETATAPAATVAAVAEDPLLSHDPAPGEKVGPGQQDDQSRPIMQMQVVLERLGFGPGVIDGKMGLSTRNALSGFQQANDLQITGEPDEPTRAALERWSNIPATRVVTIPADFAAGPFAPLPKDPAEQAKLPGMGYASLEEKLAERFHTTPETLRALNASSLETTPVPSAGASPSLAPRGYAAGQLLRVPNVGADAIDAGQVEDNAWLATLRSLGVGTRQPKLSRIEVSKSGGTLKGFDRDDKLVAVFTVTTGSSHDPLPLGEWKINGTSYNPKFSYDPSLFWDVSDEKGEHLLPPGPNGPVGVVWIDLSKEHYGIHGTPEPQTIGRAESHGCVRLTNWDAARLAEMVDSSTRVLFKA